VKTQRKRRSANRRLNIDGEELLSDAAELGPGREEIGSPKMRESACGSGLHHPRTGAGEPLGDFTSLGKCADKISDDLYHIATFDKSLNTPQIPMHNRLEPSHSPG
jgi:hypothetical protein